MRWLSSRRPEGFLTSASSSRCSTSFRKSAFCENRATLHKNRAVLHENRATLHENPVTFHKNRATLQAAGGLLDERLLKPLLHQLQEVRILRKSSGFTQKSSNFTRKSSDFTRKSSDFTRKSSDFIGGQRAS